MKNTMLSAMCVAFLVVSCLNGCAVYALADKSDFRRVIIGFTELPSPALIQRYGGQITYTYHAIPAIACWLPPQAIQALENNPQIAYIEDDFSVSLLARGQVGWLRTRAFLDGEDLKIPYDVDGVQMGVTPDRIKLDVGTYLVSATYNGETQKQEATILFWQITVVEFHFTASPPQPNGYLTVEAQLDNGTSVSAIVDVYLDGVLQYQDETPFTKELDPDTYRVDATYEDQLQQRYTEVYSEQTTTEIFVFEAPPLPLPQGTLHITTTPVAGEVFIDGLPQGLAPVTKDVDVGSYTISFGDVAGYITPASQTVDVYDSQTTYVEGVYDVLLPPPQGTLQITTTPVRGEVFIDGISHGLAPVEEVVDVGSYTVSFGDVSGYVTPAPQIVEVSADATTSVEGVYEEAPPEPEPDPEVPWGVDRIDADLAWGASTGVNIQVAILDTGIDKDHPDLKDNILAGINFVYSWIPWLWNPNAWDDDHGHGTWCAGIVGALENDFGVKGVAPNVDLVAVKVLDSSGSGYMSDIIAGIEWCMDNHIDVISMSFGGSTYSNAFHNICNEAYVRGIVLVAASGNTGDGNSATNDVQYPGKYESVIAVAGIDDSDVVASFSSDGAEVELCAPAVAVTSTWRGGGYNTGSGTSAACPHVSGTIALLMSLKITLPQFAGVDTNGNGQWDSGEVHNRLVATADDLGAIGWDVFYGHGLIDAQEAVTGVHTTP